MSADLDKKIDALRAKLIATANTPIGMGNYKQQMRTYQEMLLGVINAIDDINESIDAEVGKA